MESRDFCLDDFSTFMEDLSLKSTNSGNSWVVFTGTDGYLTFRLNYNFQIYGREKLPRKLKKKIFMTKKIRLKYLPKYYETKKD